MADQPLQDSARPEDLRVTAARIHVYATTEGRCPCGENRGHTGWLLCALAREEDT